MFNITIHNHNIGDTLWMDISYTPTLYMSRPLHGKILVISEDEALNPSYRLLQPSGKFLQLRACT